MTAKKDDQEANWSEAIEHINKEELAPVLERLTQADANGDKYVDASDIDFAVIWPLSQEEKKEYPNDTYSRNDCRKWLRDSGFTNWSPRNAHSFVKAKGTTK